MHVEGARAKPSRSVRVGEVISVTKGEVRFEVVVQALSTSRGPSAVAQTLYDETAESRAERERRAQARRNSVIAQPPAPDGRPDKRQRRQLRRLRGR